MAVVDILNARDWVELLISGVSVLGGFMAFFSGQEAWLATLEDAPPAEVAARVNRGLARGFEFGFRAAVLAGAILALGL